MAAHIVSALPGDAPGTAPPQKGAVTVEPAVDELLDAAARACVDRVIDWTIEHAAEYGQRVEGIRVYRWQSAEEPDWVQAVIEVKTVGESEAVRRLWDAAIDKLQSAIDASPTPATELLTIRFDWLDPHWR